MSRDANRMIDFSHRRILVTGAAQGLGLGIARHMARCGAALVLTDVNRRLEDHLRDAVFARTIGEMTLSDFDRLVAVNQRAPFSLSQGALVAMTRALAVELAPRVRVAAVSADTRHIDGD